MAKNEEKNQEQAGEATEVRVVDAAYMALQPTSAKLNPEVVNAPADRFREEVPKSEASADAVDAHPLENQPPYGVTEKGQPDTSGRNRF